MDYKNILEAMDTFAQNASSLAKQSTINDTGYLTLEESEVIDNMINNVIEESIEDFIPEEYLTEGIIDKAKEIWKNHKTILD